MAKAASSSLEGHVHSAGIAGHGDGAHPEPHLPHGSWWPFWVAIGIALVGLGIIAFGQSLKSIQYDPDTLDDVVETDFHWDQMGFVGLAFLLLTVGFLLATLVGWFRQDYTWWKTNTGTGERIPKAGTLLFISSEIFLFGGLFSVYFSSRTNALDAGLHWPDISGHLALLQTSGFLKLGLFSLCLFASSATIHHAEKALLRNDKRTFDLFWLLTILLGVVFLAGQVWEYYELIHEGHTLGSSRYITAFYMITGTHGAHVFGGLVFLTIVHIRSRKGQFDAHRHAAPQCASLYWHFVDIVWVVVLLLVYIWPALAS